MFRDGTRLHAQCDQLRDKQVDSRPSCLVPELLLRWQNPQLLETPMASIETLHSPRRPQRAMLAVACTVLVVCTSAQRLSSHEGECPYWHQKLDERLHLERHSGSTAAQDIIIRFSHGRAEWASALRAHGDRVHGDHQLLNALSARVHGADLDALAGNDAVSSVSIDAAISSHATGDEDDERPEPMLVRETLALGSSSTGDRVGIAVIDSGIEYSDDFEGRITAFYDFTAGGIASVPYDDFGHGTHVAGIAGGSGKRSSSDDYAGIAPRVRLIGLKVLDSRGSGRTSDVIRAIEFAVQNAARLRIDVINLSLGHPIYESVATDPLVQAVEAASRAGITVVVSAGNYGRGKDGVGYAGITSPGNAPSAITVGAFNAAGTVTRRDDRLTDYSSRGPTWIDGAAKPDLVAPGHTRVATAAQRGYLYRSFPELRDEDDDYVRLSGTSMAAAAVSGVVAHMIEANRNSNSCSLAACSLSPNALKAILHYTAIGMSDPQTMQPYHTLEQGSGALNAGGAIALARAIDTRKAVDQMWLRQTITPMTRVGSEYESWSQAIVWGNTILAGNSVHYNQPAWATAIVWGNQATTWGKAIVWGNMDPVWDSPALWANAIVWGNTLLGTAGGSAIVWGNVDSLTPTTVAWAKLPPTSDALALANPELAK
jgi:serine protease AprX